MTAFFWALLGVCLAVELISLRHALDGVEYDCRVSKTVVEPGEELELITVLTNRRRRFLPFLRIVEDVPGDMRCGQELETLSVSGHRAALRSSAYLTPRQRLTRRTAFSLPARGRHLFLGASLAGGDFLGLSERSRAAEVMREVVVLPKSVGSDVLDALPGGLMGEKSVRRFIHEDPILTMGFREYTGREPMKRISWVQTARTGRMMVRNMDYTMERTASVILNVQTFAFGSYGEELLEKGFSLARGVCERLEELRVPYSFYTNARMAGGEGLTGEAGDGLGQAHLRPILEGLGRASCDWTDTLWALIDRASAAAGDGRTVILITPMRQDLADSGVERIVERTGVEPRILTVMEVEA